MAACRVDEAVWCVGAAAVDAIEVQKPGVMRLGRAVCSLVLVVGCFALLAAAHWGYWQYPHQAPGATQDALHIPLTPHLFSTWHGEQGVAPSVFIRRLPLLNLLQAVQMKPVWRVGVHKHGTLLVDVTICRAVHVCTS